MPVVLLLESINTYAATWFADHGWEVHEYPGALNEEELLKEYQNRPFEFIGIRSKTKLPAHVLKKLPKLIGVGCFCIGTDQVDITAATNQGIVIFNSPFTSSRSVAELVLGYIISLSRRLMFHNTSVHGGLWSKTATDSHEIKGQTLGIVGYGHIGTQLSVLAEALGMHVIFYDILAKMPLGSARACNTLEELLTKADIVTLHVPRTAETVGMIGRDQLACMKRSAVLINASRGSVVDLDALAIALKSKCLGGAAIDVYPIEPSGNGSFEAVLQNLDSVILTPHIGGATEEAQYRIAVDVSDKLLTYYQHGCTRSSVNFPIIDPRVLEDNPKIMHIHYNKPGVIGTVTRILGDHNYNICGQLLGTNDHIGYAIIGVTVLPEQGVIDKLLKVANTISVRVILRGCAQLS
ncbi:hypothetical protein LCGC14_1931910 [marine sediment metagenome]|uniref:2-oxoglutarate reductase n=1 Tax=marine sediment metagenome TaxID=412755 RepID=A0A0F9GB64_9ZZZZ